MCNDRVFSIIFIQSRFVDPNAESVVNLFYCTALLNDYCSASPTALLNGFQVLSSFTTRLGDNVQLFCANGYVQPSQPPVATCTALNLTTGQWSFSSTATCTGTRGDSFLASQSLLKFYCLFLSF